MNRRQSNKRGTRRPGQRKTRGAQRQQRVREERQERKEREEREEEEREEREEEEGEEREEGEEGGEREGEEAYPTPEEQAVVLVWCIRQLETARVLHHHVPIELVRLIASFFFRPFSFYVEKGERERQELTTIVDANGKDGSVDIRIHLPPYMDTFNGPTTYLLVKPLRSRHRQQQQVEQASFKSIPVIFRCCQATLSFDLIAWPTTRNYFALLEADPAVRANSFDDWATSGAGKRALYWSSGQMYDSLSEVFERTIHGAPVAQGDTFQIHLDLPPQGTRSISLSPHLTLPEQRTQHGLYVMLRYECSSGLGTFETHVRMAPVCYRPYQPNKPV